MGSSTTCEVSVVIPVFRNADTLVELCDRVVQAIQTLRIPYEILFVNDASTDHSASILESLAETNRKVAAIFLASNMGQSNAVLTGLRYADGQYALIMDADLQDPPEAIPFLVSTIRNEPQIAALFAGKSGNYESRLRRSTGYFLKHILNWLCGTPVDAGGFCIINREMIDRVINFSVKRPYMLSLIGCAGLPMKSVPIARSARKIGKSSYTAWKRFHLGCSAIGIVIRMKLGLIGDDGTQKQPVIQFLGAKFANIYQEASR